MCKFIIQWGIFPYISRILQIPIPVIPIFPTTILIIPIFPVIIVKFIGIIGKIGIIGICRILDNSPFSEAMGGQFYFSLPLWVPYIHASLELRNIS